MKRLVLLAVSLIALAPASSALGAGRSYTPDSFDGTYRIQMNVTATVTSPGAPSSPHKMSSSALLRVVNGSVSGNRIRMFGTLGRGSVDIAVPAPGFPWFRIRENLRFTITNTTSTWVMGTLSGFGNVPGAKGTVVREIGTIRGNRI